MNVLGVFVIDRLCVAVFAPRLLIEDIKGTSMQVGRGEGRGRGGGRVEGVGGERGRIERGVGGKVIGNVMIFIRPLLSLSY